MSQNILVEKMKMLKELCKLAEIIKTRPKYMDIKKTRIKTENLPKVAEGDSKFIKSLVYNCNPLYHLTFVTNETGKDIVGIKIMSDIEGMSDIEKHINDTFDFSIIKKRNDSFVTVEELNIMINMKLLVSYDQISIFSSNKELVEYIDKYLEYIQPCLQAMQLFEYNSKKTMIRIVKDSIQFANTLKEIIDRPDVKFDQFKWRVQ